MSRSAPDVEFVAPPAFYPGRRRCGACQGWFPAYYVDDASGACLTCHVNGHSRPKRLPVRKMRKAPAPPPPAVAPADLERIVAGLSPVLRDVHNLLNVQGLGVREAARRRGVRHATIIGARRRLDREIGRRRARATTCPAPVEFRKRKPMTKIPVRAGNVEVFMDPGSPHEGYCPGAMTISLDARQAVIANRLYNALAAGGVALAHVADCFGWLLDQVGAQLENDARIVARAVLPGPCAVCGSEVSQQQLDAGEARVYVDRGVATLGHAAHFKGDGRDEAGAKMDAAHAAAIARLKVGAE